MRLQPFRPQLGLAVKLRERLAGAKALQNSLDDLLL